jgi:hypothetical protein
MQVPENNVISDNNEIRVPEGSGYGAYYQI